MDECKEMIMEKVERLIRTDSRDEFAFFLRNHLESSGLSTPLLSSSELLKSICSHRAVGCAAALLEGETGLSVDLKVTLEDGLSPLHLAAQSLSYGLTKLFLRHGARMRLHFGLMDPARLPLRVALNALSHDKYVGDWTPKKSVFKLLYIFCLPQLKESLGTIKLLASKASKKQIESTCSDCVKAGEVVQVAALLIASWNKMLFPFSNEGLESCPVWQFILREEREIEHSPCEVRKTKLRSSKKVVQILWRALDVLENYRYSTRPMEVPNYEVPFDVAYELFRKARLVLKPSDVFSNDVKCLRPKLDPEEEAKLNEAIEKQISLGVDLSTPIVKHVHSGSVLGTLAGNCAIGTGMYLPSRSFHTGRGLCFNSNTVGRQLVMKPSSIEFLPEAKICARLLLTAKRCIK